MSAHDILMSAAGGTSLAANYIEDVFSTYLYTGNGSTQTITNGIDLSGKGGLIWLKSRSGTTLAGYDKHLLFDTARGNTVSLSTNNTAANESGYGDSYLRFLSTGFDTGSGGTGQQEYLNKSGVNYASWTFREQPKFFDIVTFSGNSVAGRQIPHNLNSVPGMIILKSTNVIGPWYVYHRSDPTKYGLLYTADAFSSFSAQTVFGNNTTTVAPTSTVFTVGTDSTVNNSGDTYVAYLFAHDAGGFGLTGTDNVISCGSYVGNGSATGPVIDLGYEPQWVMVKRTTDGIEDWEIYDNMRGIVPAGADQILYPNSSLSEQSATRIQISATGFSPDGTAGSVNTSGKTYIYIAIRRGPMKVPTSGTSVFTPDAGTNGTSGGIVPTGFPVDLSLTAYRSLGGVAIAVDRLRGFGNSNIANANPMLQTSLTSSEAAFAGFNPYFYSAWNTTITRGSNGANPGGAGIITWFFRRAPGFFDEVCWTGLGGSRNLAHNLNAVPELIITKRRDGINFWYTYSAAMGNTSFLYLNDPSAVVTGQTIWNSTTPTSSVFSVAASLNGNTLTYVSYLFATVAGVSKVGSYSGTGTTQVINCGFTNGARFVLIKRTDDTGDWYVWDSARGIVAGNDPYLLLNSSAAEVTSTDFVDPVSSGFEISSTAPAAINASGGSYIYLAIA